VTAPIPGLFALRQKEPKMSKEKASELDRIRERRARRSSTDVADWSSANPLIVLQAISTVSARGGALRFGYTRDGGAYALGIYLNGDHFTEYIRPHEDIDRYLETIIADIGGTA
jgi:hypothetical protein